MPVKDGLHLLRKGQIIKGCKVLDFLGAGGMGQVFKCEHLALQRTVAVKVLPALDPASIERFLREARSAAKIWHPNVIIIHDVDQDKDTKLYFIIMQFIEGRNLAQMVAESGRPIPWKKTLKLMRGAVMGTGAVHAQGLVHRDIKPANIMFSKETHKAILMDFGLVRESDPSGTQLTVGAAGTPNFMSPEQCRGEAHLTARSDIVALGRTMYYLLTGRSPYEHKNKNKERTLDIIDQILSGRPPTPVNTLNPAVPIEVSRMVDRAMAFDPSQRFPDTKALLAAINDALKLGDVPDTVSFPGRLAPSPPVADADIPELELISDDFPTDRSTAKWAYAGAGFGLVAFVFLAWFLNSYAGRENRDVKDKKSPAPDVVAKSAPAKMTRVPSGKVYLGHPRDVITRYTEAMGFGDKLSESFVRLAMERSNTVADVPAFWIDQFEVTNGEYASFVQQTKRTPPKHWSGSTPPAALADHPVVQVSHADALAYAQWAKKKLPTDAQWLRAFRGDAQTLFPWGNELSANSANVKENTALRDVKTVAVTATPADKSFFGVFNMVGNVEELLRDQEHYQGARCALVRGGCWNQRGVEYGTAAFPFRYGNGLEVNEVAGFRCVREDVP